MVGVTVDSEDGELNESTPFDPIRENHEAIEQFAKRADQLGAQARVALALARNKRPTDNELEAAGYTTPDGEVPDEYR
jgi:uncharacterized protein YbjQ (UPF0145 family)